MMPSRVQTKKFTVQHMRQPSQGMPVGSMGGSKGPSDVVPTQTSAYVYIVGYVFTVVKVDKGMILHLPEDGKDS